MKNIMKKNNNINELNSSFDENKIKTVVTNNDKEIIKNIISSTVKKIKVNINTYNSEFSSLNNNSTYSMQAFNEITVLSGINQLKLSKNLKHILD
jgi:hypothetical protein